MKNRFRLIMPIAMAIFSLTSCDLFSKSKSNSKDYGEYYKGYDMSLKGGRLASELQKLCFEKHTQWVTYGQVNTYFSRATDSEGNVIRNSAEAAADGSELNEYFYTGLQQKSYGTREHVWPCANSSSLWVHDDSSKKDKFNIEYNQGKYYLGGGSDLFHVRTCESKLNTARGNSKFVDFDDSDFSNIRSQAVSYPKSGGGWKVQLYGMESGDKYAQLCEPDDNMKGDIARIIIYLWVHYTERGVTPDVSLKCGDFNYTYKDFTGQLSFTNIMGYSDVKKCQEVLKEWNKMDEPSSVERLRNDTVQKIQGNRNPFVDHPELMDQLF